MISIYDRSSGDFTHRQYDFLDLDTFGLTDEELAKIMTPDDIKEMKEFLASLDKKKDAVHRSKPKRSPPSKRGRSEQRQA